MKLRFYVLTVLFTSVFAAAQGTPNTVTVDLNHQFGPMKIDRFSLGQGGFSPDPMFTDRVPEIRLLHPRVIRLFVQEYYDLLPKAGDYQFSKLDPSIDAILKTGATPLLCLVFKPKVLFPRIDQDLVTPTSWAAWEDLVYHLVRYYRDRNGGGWYWEVGNEVDQESGGGAPYHMPPGKYAIFYEHTARAIRRADPQAHVGGPALTHFNSHILGALLTYASQHHLPLDFVSWHIYSTDVKTGPKYFRHTLDQFHELLSHYPDLHPEAVIDEWNLLLGKAPFDPAIQAAFIAETSFQMLEGGIDLSCYYQIRDYPMDPAVFLKFYPKSYVLDTMRFWDRHSVYLGLFDYENQVRPSYFVFRLLERLTGDRVWVESNDDQVHAMASRDNALRISSVLIWNYSQNRANVMLRLNGIPSASEIWRYDLDARNPNPDENSRLKFQPPVEDVKAGTADVPLALEPWGITLISIEQR